MGKPVRGAGEAWGGGGAGGGAASSTGGDAGVTAAGAVVVVTFGAVVLVVDAGGRLDVVVGRVVVVEVDVVVVVGGLTVCTHRKSAPQADPASRSRVGRIRRRMGSEATIPALWPQLVELRPSGWDPS
jgi:hypothetical protein